MKIGSPHVVKTDVLVIGGGLAGMRAAIQAKKRGVDVLLLSETRVGYRNNSAYSGGAFAANPGWIQVDDSPDVHLKDTLLSGCFINDQRLVKIMTCNIWQQVHDLEEFGVRFIKHDGDISKIRLPGHSYPRTVYCEARIGQGFTLPLRQHVLDMGIKVIEGILVIKLLSREDACVGIMGIDQKQEVLVCCAKAIILATGGVGQLFLRTDNLPGAAGDSHALAYELGLPLKDMELIQYYPTSLGPNGGTLVFYEAYVVAEGAVFRNSLGEDILERHGLKNAPSLTRDKITQAIMIELLEGRDINGTIRIDASAFNKDNWERVQPWSAQNGLIHKKGSFEIAPTAHFSMGGIVINENCETGLNGLYAAGEVCAGVHGANRLGSNAISETLVFGSIAGDNAANRAMKQDWLPVDEGQVSSQIDRLMALVSSGGSENVEELRQSLKRTMWYNAGPVRNEKSLNRALKDILLLQKSKDQLSIQGPQELLSAIRVGNMLTVSEMVCRAALKRTESRGSHYRTDYPEENNEGWLKNIVITKENGKMKLSLSPVELVYLVPT